ncbi:UNKNOWN [Stylonychia lemnae]|uniref:Uncharacterized protein n=1 Tax=Stylonychia lemnae TaxID=5949 RepID=A0A078A1E2_STYLE|nr:UNKNOWN [Stylonychia lemnae]|eukprot:CDW75915.1 UNKNOWN [Stylonychia lemnae]
MELFKQPQSSVNSQYKQQPSSQISHSNFQKSTRGVGSIDSSSNLNFQFHLQSQQSKAQLDPNKMSYQNLPQTKSQIPQLNHLLNPASPPISQRASLFNNSYLNSNPTQRHANFQGSFAQNKQNDSALGMIAVEQDRFNNLVHLSSGFPIADIEYNGEILQRIPAQIIRLRSKQIDSYFKSNPIYLNNYSHKATIQDAQMITDNYRNSYQQSASKKSFAITGGLQVLMSDEPKTLNSIQRQINTYNGQAKKVTPSMTKEQIEMILIQNRLQKNSSQLKRNSVNIESKSKFYQNLFHKKQNLTARQEQKVCYDEIQSITESIQTSLNGDDDEEYHDITSGGGEINTPHIQLEDNQDQDDLSYYERYIGDNTSPIPTRPAQDNSVSYSQIDDRENMTRLKNDISSVLKSSDLMNSQNQIQQLPPPPYKQSKTINMTKGSDASLTPHYFYIDLNKDGKEDDNELNEKLKSYFQMKFQQKKQEELAMISRSLIRNEELSPPQNNPLNRVQQSSGFFGSGLMSAELSPKSGNELMHQKNKHSDRLNSQKIPVSNLQDVSPDLGRTNRKDFQLSQLQNNLLSPLADSKNNKSKDMNTQASDHLQSTQVQKIDKKKKQAAHTMMKEPIKSPNQEIIPAVKKESNKQILNFNSSVQSSKPLNKPQEYIQDFKQVKHQKNVEIYNSLDNEKNKSVSSSYYENKLQKNQKKLTIEDLENEDESSNQDFGSQGQTPKTMYHHHTKMTRNNLKSTNQLGFHKSLDQSKQAQQQHALSQKVSPTRPNQALYDEIYKTLLDNEQKEKSLTNKIKDFFITPLKIYNINLFGGNDRDRNNKLGQNLSLPRPSQNNQHHPVSTQNNQWRLSAQSQNVSVKSAPQKSQTEERVVFQKLCFLKLESDIRQFVEIQIALTQNFILVYQVSDKNIKLANRPLFEIQRQNVQKDVLKYNQEAYEGNQTTKQNKRFICKAFQALNNNIIKLKFNEKIDVKSNHLKITNQISTLQDQCISNFLIKSQQDEKIFQKLNQMFKKTKFVEEITFAFNQKSERDQFFKLIQYI